jgi:hypothetical protein
MFPFDKISLNQILVLSVVLAESTLLENEFIEEKHLKRAPNYKETIEFLSKIGSISKKGNRIILEPEYKAALEKFKEAPNREGVIREYLVKIFIVKKNCFSKYISDFLTLFQLRNDKYEFSSTHQRLLFSGLRNLLISIGFLELDPDKRKVVVSEEFVQIYKASLISEALPLDEFLDIIKRRNNLALAAELEVLKYEKKRLSRFPLLVDKIEHVSLEDVCAGYDIKSFDMGYDERGQPIPRYIEVKAVSPVNFSFYWSRNEIDKARKSRQQYYLYLIPVLSNRNFDVKNILVIKDAYLNVYIDRKKWRREEELIGFSLPKDKNTNKAGKNMSGPEK